MLLYLTKPIYVQPIRNMEWMCYSINVSIFKWIAANDTIELQTGNTGWGSIKWICTILILSLQQSFKPTFMFNLCGLRGKSLALLTAGWDRMLCVVSNENYLLQDKYLYDVSVGIKYN